MKIFIFNFPVDNNSICPYAFTTNRKSIKDMVNFIFTLEWDYGEGLTRRYTAPAEIIHSTDLYRDGMDELLIGFSELPNLYVYSFSTSSHSVIARIKPSQMVTGDLTGDGHNELVFSCTDRRLFPAIIRESLSMLSRALI